MFDFNDTTWINYVDGKVWEYLPASSLKTRNNSEIVFRCPICGDSKKNKLKKRGYFYRKTGTYHCFNCEANLTGYAFLKAICSPDVFNQIIQDYKVLNFDRIVKGGQRKNGNATIGGGGMEPDFEILSPNPSYKYLLDMGWAAKPLSSEATAYLDSRLVPLDRRDMFMSMYDITGREFILIQYIWEDRTIYHQLANFNKYDIAGQGSTKYIFPKDENINFQSKPVFNIGNVDISFPYIICTEGVFDSLFVKNGVALGGRSLTDYQEKMIQSCYPRHKIVLAFDNDDAGIQSALKHAGKNPNLLFLDMYQILDAAGVKDLNDFAAKTKRLDVFTNEKLVEKLITSAFGIEMKMKLHR